MTRHIVPMMIRKVSSMAFSFPIKIVKNIIKTMCYWCVISVPNMCIVNVIALELIYLLNYTIE